MDNRNEEYLSETAISLGLSLSGEQIRQFRIYYENLVEWNKVMNLTAITEEKDVYEKHFADSIMIFRAIPLGKWSEQTKLIDVGTGAGFPGLPIAICLPSVQITLMDSLQKRIRFLQDTVDRLGLTNVTLIHSRAEELARNKEHREKYDLCVSRAVANLSTLTEYCLAFVRVGGDFVSYKTESISEELEKGQKAVRILGGQSAETDYYVLPQTDYHRSLVKIHKVRQTPGKYPRKAGIPSKEPL